MKAIIAGPITLLLVYRAYTHKSLTPAGIVAAVATAIAHAVHPWNLPFALLIIFFLAGTRVTKVKHDVKVTLTQQSTGSAGGEGARTHIQVLANSAVASILTLLHAYQLHKRAEADPTSRQCYSWPGDILIVGIVANYASVAADTFSSELGILSTSQPRLITSLSFRKVPRGTNGGVTLHGLTAGLLGSMVIVAASMALIPFCPPVIRSTGKRDPAGWKLAPRNRFAIAMSLWGAAGSVLDSLLGGWFQKTVVDTRTGKVVEGYGGATPLISKGGPNSIHHRKRAEIKNEVLGGEGKETVQAASHAEDGLTQKIGRTDRYDVRKKFRTPSFGDERPSRVVESGSVGVLDNNQVNFLMALLMSLGAMGVASWFWQVPLISVLAV